jgi:hypothetical protein
MCDRGGKMISSSCDFKEFAETIMDDDRINILYMAEREATDAERQSYRIKTSRTDREKCGKQYADTLKCFLSFMRYGIKSASVSDDDYKLFQAIHRQVQKRSAKDLNAHLIH